MRGDYDLISYIRAVHVDGGFGCRKRWEEQAGMTNSASAEGWYSTLLDELIDIIGHGAALELLRLNVEARGIQTKAERIVDERIDSLREKPTPAPEPSRVICPICQGPCRCEEGRR